MSALPPKADMCGLLFPARSSQSCYSEVKHWLPIIWNSAGWFAVYSASFLTIGVLQMITFPATSLEEDLFIPEVSDEALAAAGGNDVAGNYTLADCTGLSVCPA
jgi:hypothetical protein